MKRNKKTIKKVLSLFSIALAATSSLFLTSCQGDAETYDLNADVISDLENGILQGNLAENYTLDADVLYKLEGAFVVSSGTTLTIPAGTNIEAHKGGSNIFIVVLPGAKININGTDSDPVIMSTYDGVAGGWGGITIFGLAHSLGERSSSAAFYGGPLENDNSGTISYLNIIGSGNKLSTDENYNGLSLFGVGSGTSINNVAIINSLDDGVEFYGGSVSINNLYIENTADDAIDWTEGWNGSITNAYVLNEEAFSSMLEADFVEDPDNIVSFDNPTITNLSVVSTVSDTSTLKTGLQFKNDTGASISGLYLEGIDIDIDMLNNGDVSNVIIDAAAADVTLVSGDTTTAQYTLNSGKDAEKVDISDWTWIRRSLED